jgi:hypothetical protein
MTLAVFVLCLSQPGYGLRQGRKPMADQSESSRDWEPKRGTV